MAWADRVASLREERPAGVLEAVRFYVDAEAHRRRLRRNVQLAQQPDEVRVPLLVEDDEAGVNLVGTVRGVDANGVRVPAHVVVLFEDGEIVVAGAGDEIGGNVTRDSGSDDGDLHGRSRASRKKNAGNRARRFHGWLRDGHLDMFSVCLTFVNP